jgi:hypothetical protein
MNLNIVWGADITPPPPPSSVSTNSTISKTCVTEGLKGVLRAIFMHEHDDK